MERDGESIQEIITQITALLRANDEQEWASHLDKLACMFNDSDDKADSIKEILNIYKGGMGSFTDLVLQKDYKMLVDENNQLADLKHKLYSACLEYCGSDQVDQG